ncbi:MAG: DUF4430 domain-containing protein [Roseburia sp.]|nr:DUF4430 domain-containing protein [Roseburia sp.]
MRKRIVALVLILVMTGSIVPEMKGAIRSEAKTLVIWDGTTKTEPEEKEGVYQIGSPEELAWFAEHVNSLCNDQSLTGLVEVDAVLTEDIDLANRTWTPISDAGSIKQAYSGTFDGQNHTISDLKINTDKQNQGLFALVNGATIKNVNVEGNVTSEKKIGGIVGTIQSGQILNCSMSGSVTTTGTGTGSGCAGGIIGTAYNPDVVVNGCCNNAQVSGDCAGGIIGDNTKKDVTITNCYNTGKITNPEGHSGTLYCGGIAGRHTNSSGTISYCYSIGESKNGICGSSNASIVNCYYLAEKTQDEVSKPSGTATGYQTITDSSALLAALNADGSEKAFCEGTKNVNQGYPVLNWQSVTGVLSVPVEKVMISGEAKTGSEWIAEATGQEDEMATNVKYQWALSADGITFTDISGATTRNFAVPDEAEYVGTYIRVTVTGEEGSTASNVKGPIAKSDTLLRKENSEKVQEAKKSLSLDQTVITKEEKLELPNVSGDCQIRWTSSRPEIIHDTGDVVLPDEGVVEVTLTAEIICGEETDHKTFSVDVWAKDIDERMYLQKVLDAMKWDFKLLQPVCGEDTNILSKFSRILKNKGYYGVAVTVQSTADERLVSKNGRISYPAPEAGSFADGRQVKVFFNLTMGDQTVTYPTTDNYALLIPWDTEDITSSLEQSADAVLTESALCGENPELSAVSSDLTLPSYIDGDKFSFAQITWSSSDESHLAISDENRTGSADAFYNPYVGKIYQDSEKHTVSLTATVKNPSTDTVVSRTFEVTILPMSEEQMEQTMDKMNRILACYTPDKLTDYTTKATLDCAAVRHDIGLVIPGNVVTKKELAGLNYGEYWDYWNYKFSVTSSDPDVIEINGFRAYVYRPLGEDASADKEVTLEVKMASKKNPNLFVTKKIKVSVAHLGRAEINQALALMDQAKSGYADGLLGENTDLYSVIDNLKPYKEIIWNKDQSGIEYIYRHADMKNNGIIVDELPGWESQEDWRLFHSNDKELIANETLILNKTPAEDTFVKINSVLTDEVFGKYYIKFQKSEGYDAEALAKFKQLYKQPVSAYVAVLGEGNYTSEFSAMDVSAKEAAYSQRLSAYKKEIEQPISVTFCVLGREGEEIIPQMTEESFSKGATVFDVFQKVMNERQIPYTAKGSYIVSINDLSEFSDGDNSGWMYTVGGVYVNSYMNAQELYGGEEIVIKYVTDYTQANRSEEVPNPPTPSETPGENLSTPEPSAAPENSAKPAETSPAAGQSAKPEGAGSTADQPASTDGRQDVAPDQEDSEEEVSKDDKKTNKKKKTISLSKVKYKKGTRKITGKTLKGAKVKIQVGKTNNTVKADSKGRFTLRLKKKLKRGMKIKITVSKAGYRTKTKKYKVK